MSQTELSTRDVVARKNLDAAAYHLAAIVESSDDAIISKDLNSIITTWNKGAENLFGYTADEAIGKHISLLIPSERLSEENHIIGAIRAGKRVEHYETVRRRKDGSLVDVSLTVSPVKDARGQIVGASKIARNITETKRAEQALRESERKLAEANAALDQKVRERTASLENALAQMEEFSYSVSHDLRAPLRAIEAYTRFLAEDHAAQLDAEGQDFLAKISRNVSRMNRLINDVLALSRLARAEMTLRRIRLRSLIEEIIEQNPHFQSPAAEIKLEVAHDLIGDEVSLSQAITNLLNNAVKFVRPGVKPVVRVWTEARGHEVRIWIEDNGIGIKPDQLGKLFGMFQRLSTTHAYEGTGIGLAIVRKAVERMGGSAGAESDGENGSRFWIQLKSAGA
jgi:PAS domain S-box-containing protein